MLIEPTPASPSSTRGHVRTALAIAAPLIVLVSVVFVGVYGTSGPEAERSQTAETSASPTSADPSTPAPSGDAAAEDPPAEDAAVSARMFPSRALGLRVRSVADVLAARRTGVIGDEPVAIGGFLSVANGARDCVTPSDGIATDAAMCHRDAAIVDDPGAGATSSDSLRAHAFQGVSLGPFDLLATDAAASSRRPQPAIVIGRFGAPRLADPRSNDRHPNLGFAIERLVWVAGRWQERGVALSLPRTAGDVARSEVADLASAALPSGAVVLYYTALDAAALTRLQPDAADVVAVPRPATDELYWYVRVMARSAPPIHALASDLAPRRLGWVVLAADGMVLGTRMDVLLAG
jgi:hypothetical protein